MSHVDRISYVECDVPPGQTLAEWRRARDLDRRPRGRRARRRAALLALRRACRLA